MADDVLELLKKHSEENFGLGTSEEKIIKLEEKLKIQIPKEYRNFLKEIGYAEIFGDEIYSIYENENVACLGIYFQNKNNNDLKNGYLKFWAHLNLSHIENNNLFSSWKGFKLAKKR